MLAPTPPRIHICVMIVAATSPIATNASTSLILAILISTSSSIFGTMNAILFLLLLFLVLSE